jgi:hypothetical protein
VSSRGGLSRPDAPMDAVHEEHAGTGTGSHSRGTGTGTGQGRTPHHRDILEHHALGATGNSLAHSMDEDDGGGDHHTDGERPLSPQASEGAGHSHSPFSPTSAPFITPATPASLDACPPYNAVIKACWQHRELRRPTAAQVGSRDLLQDMPMLCCALGKLQGAGSRRAFAGHCCASLPCAYRGRQADTPRSPASAFTLTGA